MISNLTIAVAIYCAYLIGSFSSAIVICKFMGLPDPRLQGSRNPGATNVLRLGGKKAAILTLLSDMLKGLLPVLLAKAFGFDIAALALIALAAFLGHLFPLFFRFEGGKGVATALGSLLALSWPVGCSMMITWLIVAIITRYASLASLITAFVAPLLMWYFTKNHVAIIVVSTMSLLLIIRHRRNIVKLCTGSESKIGRR